MLVEVFGDILVGDRMKLAIGITKEHREVIGVFPAELLHRNFRIAVLVRLCKTDFFLGLVIALGEFKAADRERFLRVLGRGGSKT